MAEVKLEMTTAIYEPRRIVNDVIPNIRYISNCN